jgi:antitoxin component YwqK of YwqJK toxin-antitoxin module
MIVVINIKRIVLFAIVISMLLVSVSMLNANIVLTTDKLRYENDIAYGVDSVTPYTGTVIDYYDNGDKKLEEHYKNGKEDGLLVFWNNDGTWYSDNTKGLEINYKSGKEDGKKIIWSKDGSQKLYEGDYSNNKLNGLAISWFKSGQKWQEQSYKNGDVDGDCIVWYKNGHKQSKSTYIQGKKAGLYMSWYENGKQQEETYYLNDKKDGLSIKWSLYGQKTSQENYKKGILI